MRRSRRAQGPGDDEAVGVASTSEHPSAASVSLLHFLGHGLRASPVDHDGSQAAAADALAPSVPARGRRW